MKKLSIVFFLFLIVFCSCNENKQAEEADVTEVQAEENVSPGYLAVGEEFNAEGAMQMEQLGNIYQNLTVGDTLDVDVIATVHEVCKKKGCWMKLENGEMEEVMVKMKDYKFFVPKDIDGKEVVVSGKAYVTEMSVEDQQHYAEDGGKSEEEIAAITQPKRTYSLMADGVMVKE